MKDIWVEVVRTRGSAPRDAGTAMRITLTDVEGTIGGGALEHDAIDRARRILANGVTDPTFHTYPLGPELGQCCGGSVTLRFSSEPGRLDERYATPEPLLSLPYRPRGLWIWGAGHVGRAVVRALPEGAFDVTWIDSDLSRFPAEIPDHVTALPVADMARLAARAPFGLHHLVFTYSHDIDFRVTAALIQRRTATLGLIGSDTKRARFFKRFRALGLDTGAVTCPIGCKPLGKAPSAIAVGTVRDLIRQAYGEVAA